MKLLTVPFSPVPSYLLSPNIFFALLLSNTLGLYASLNVRNQTHTKQKQTREKCLVLCVFVYLDLDVQRLADGILQTFIYLNFLKRPIWYFIIVDNCEYFKRFKLLSSTKETIIAFYMQLKSLTIRMSHLKLTETVFTLS
jgi:hypothetical protein